MTARFDIWDGDKPGTGEVVGFVQSLPTGMIQVKIDGFLSPTALEHARIQMMAAINDLKQPRRPS